MRPNLNRLLILVLALLVAATAASAEDTAPAAEDEKAEAKPAKPEWKFSWKNGFRLDSRDKKFQFKFGGRLMADFSFVSPDDELEALLGPIEDGSEFRRARLFFSGTLHHNVEFKVQYDFAAGGGSVGFNDLYIGFKDTPAGTLRIGHQFEPFSLEQMTSSKYITFLERALPNAFVPGRNTGIRLHDNVGDRFTWAVGAFRETDGFGESQGDGKLNLTGRITGLPIYEEGGKRLLHLGLSYSTKDLGDDLFRYRQRPEAHQFQRFVDTGRFAADSADLYALELAAVAGPFHVMAEWLGVEADANPLGDPSLDGFHVSLGYFLTGESRAYKTSSGAFDRTKPSRPWGKEGGRGAWEVAARYSTIDLNDGGLQGGELDDLTLALNWYPNPVTRLMLNYVNADRVDVGEANFFLIRLQVDF